MGLRRPCASVRPCQWLDAACHKRQGLQDYVDLLNGTYAASLPKFEELFASQGTLLSFKQNSFHAHPRAMSTVPVPVPPQRTHGVESGQ